MIEVLLVILLTSVLCLGLYNLFLENLNVYSSLKESSANLHNLRTGMEYLVGELQQADPASIGLSGSGFGKYDEIKFKKYGSDNLYYIYVNSSNKLIRGLKRPGKEWGYTSIASNIESLLFYKHTSQLLEIILEKDDICFKTMVSAGF